MIKSELVMYYIHLLNENYFLESNCLQLTITWSLLYLAVSSHLGRYLLSRGGIWFKLTLFIYVSTISVSPISKVCFEDYIYIYISTYMWIQCAIVCPHQPPTKDDTAVLVAKAVLPSLVPLAALATRLIYSASSCLLFLLII